MPDVTKMLRFITYITPMLPRCAVAYASGFCHLLRHTTVTYVAAIRREDCRRDVDAAAIAATPAR